MGQATRGEPAEPNLRAAAPAADPGKIASKIIYIV